MDITSFAALLKEVSGAKVILATIVIIAGIVLMFRVDKLLIGLLESVGADWKENTRYAVRMLLSSMIGIGVIMLMLKLLGVYSSGSVFLLVAIAVIISTACSSIAGNLTSGLIVRRQRPFKEGDYLDICGYRGTVKNVGITETVLESDEGVTIHIPAGQIALNSYSKIGQADPYKLKIELSVDSACEPASVFRTLKETVLSVPGVLKNKACTVNLVSATQESNDYECFFSCRYANRDEVLSAVNTAIAGLFGNGTLL